MTITASWRAQEGLSYTVRYLEKDTEKVLKEAKVVDGKAYNDEVTETAETIAGYNVEGEATKTISLKLVILK